MREEKAKERGSTGEEVKKKVLRQRTRRLIVGVSVAIGEFVASSSLLFARIEDRALAYHFVFDPSSRMWSRLWKTPGHAVGAAAAAGGQSGGGDNDPLRPNTTSASSASAASALSLDLDLKSGRGHPDDDDPSRDKKRRRLMRKLYLHTVPIACLITCATFIDRANLALAAPVLLHDIGLTRSQFGFASAVMFVSYGCCMWLSALMFTVISLRIWFCVIVSAWGVVTGLMAVVGVAGMAPATSFAVLVFLRLALGAAEAGTMPGCFLLLSRFLPKRELAYAYSWVRFKIPLFFGSGGGEKKKERFYFLSRPRPQPHLDLFFKQIHLRSSSSPSSPKSLAPSSEPPSSGPRKGF